MKLRNKQKSSKETGIPRFIGLWNWENETDLIDTRHEHDL
jgi:hypothetical protein